MDQQQSTTWTRKIHWPLVISLVLLLIIATLYFTLPEVKDFVDHAYRILIRGNEREISAWVRQLGFWGPLFIVLGMIVQMFLIIVPSPLLMLVSILVYGPYWGVCLAVMAVLAASSIGYWIGYFLGAGSLKRLISRRKERQMAGLLDRYGFWAVLVTRLVPFLSNDAISFVAGMLGMNYWKYIGATAVGITPLAILIAYFGEDRERLERGLIWTVVAALVFFLLNMLYQRRRRT